MNVAEAQKAMNYVITAKNPKKKLAGQTQSNSSTFICTYLNNQTHLKQTNLNTYDNLKHSLLHIQAYNVCWKQEQV